MSFLMAITILLVWRDLELQRDFLILQMSRLVNEKLLNNVLSYGTCKSLSEA